VVIGDGPDRERVARDARDAGLGDALQMAGFMAWDDVAETLLRASALLLPSEREGFGLAVLEAAAHGVPSVVVAEPDNAAVELIEAGHNGLVCDGADPAELARAVLSLADPKSPDRARAWYEQASATYSVHAAADAHERLYDRLLAGRA
jgi:glycosyltransferase involved in cell wall biosynthesis